MNLAMPNVGLATIEDRRLLFTKGFVPETFNSSTLYVQVPEQAIKTLELKLQGPPYYTPSGIMNLFLQVHQPTFSAQGRLGRKLEGRDNYGLEPAILQNKNISLVTSGHGVTGSVTGTKAVGTVSITDYTELNSGDKVNLIATDGTNYDFVNGDHDSVAGTWESTIATMKLPQV